MTKQFIEKIIRYGTVDTKNYRYTIRENRDNQGEIIRLPIGSLSTTDAIDGWEVVKVLK